MSGAEAAGLALGVIALASLFNSCVEVLEYIDDGKNYAADYELACTKICILHQRLRDWGGALRIKDTAHRHPLFEDAAKQFAVSRGLVRLRAILTEAEELKTKYEASVVSRTALRSDTRQSARWSLQLRRRTTWSIRDKAKFDRLINDVSFLIDNLEHVRVIPSGLAAIADPAATTPWKTKAVSVGPRGDVMPSSGDTSGSHRDAAWDPLSFCRDANRQAHKVEVAEGNQTNDGHAFGLQGYVEPGPGIYVTRGVQENKGTSCGVQGGGSVEGLARLQAAAYAFSKEVKKEAR